MDENLASNLSPRSVSQNHPLIRFENRPVVDGVLMGFDQLRPQVLQEVADRCVSSLEGIDRDSLLEEVVYLERRRIRKLLTPSPSLLFTWPRIRNDQKLFAKIRSGLGKSPAEVDRHQLLRSLVAHYGEEIGGHFNRDVYRLATSTVPFGFNWLLNAASVRNFLPWKMTETLGSRLRVHGEIEHLHELSKKGTILLVPTHQSNIDSILIGYLIYVMGLPPFAYGAGLNLFSNPVLSFFMSRLGSYTVDRQKNNSVYKNVLTHYSTSILRRGIHSVFFPGGGRVRSGAIESHLKLGLLGTALQAQIENHKQNREHPDLFIVPMVTSYHFVLEASSLIEDMLSQSGKHRFSGDRSEEFMFTRFFKFFWKFFTVNSQITVRVGKPLDVFGNLVDRDGNSIGPNGTIINRKNWLISAGELKSEPQRDREYVHRLGQQIVERYHEENTVLTSHVVAFAFFRRLRQKYPDLDLYRFLRLTKLQRFVMWEELLVECEKVRDVILKKASQGKLFIAGEILNLRLEEWVKDGINQIGAFHGANVIQVDGQVVFTEDMNLLYYYRNRLTGYGISPDGIRQAQLRRGADEKGFLV